MATSLLASHYFARKVRSICVSLLKVAAVVDDALRSCAISFLIYIFGESAT